MSNLAWVESNVIDELVGALSTTASLCAHRPNKAASIRAEAVRQLDEGGRDLVKFLYDEIERVEDSEDGGGPGV